MDAPIRVVLADDHPLLRTGVRAALALEDDIVLIGEAVDGDEAQRLARELQPDVLLLDVSMPGPPAFETVAEVRVHCPATRVLIVTAYGNAALVRGLIAAGVAGYLLKDEPNTVVVSAIRTVAAGGTWMSPAVVRTLVQPGANGDEAAGTPTLAEREVEVLRLLVAGKTDVEIGEALQLSERTVRRVLHSIYARLKVTTRVEAAVRALQLGLIEA